MAAERGWWTFSSNVELDDVDLEHIAKMVRQGYTGGRVESDEPDDDYVYGGEK